MKIVAVVGARPNLMKMAPLIAEMNRYPAMELTLVHTGQHYDAEMSEVFFDQLEMAPPDVNLQVGSGSNSWQTAEIMVRLEPVIVRVKPQLVLVVGDVNSTLAGALMAAKSGVPVAHVEAGLRSFDQGMPEELNRRVTDAVSSYLFTPSRDAGENLLREGVPAASIFFVGNVMVDSLERSRVTAAGSKVRSSLGLDGPYALVTLHRPSNVDDPTILRDQVETLRRVGDLLPVVFPVHPRTKKRLDEFGLLEELDGCVELIEPLGYADFLHLMSNAMVVLTDSGGIQEETSVLGVPCLTLRENTERPVTVWEGSNTVVGIHPDRVVAAVQEVMRGDGKKGRIPDLWDGRAAERTIAILADAFAIPAST